MKRILSLRLEPRTILLVAFGIVFLASAVAGFQPETNAAPIDHEPRVDGERPPVFLHTPESFALAPKAPTLAASTRELLENPVAAKSTTNDSLFDLLVAPLANETMQRRAQTGRTDPEYSKRVDPQLNAGRINVLLFGYGETHEPPFTERAFIGSHTLVSYNLKTRQADIISFTHDIRAPEIERELLKRGSQVPAVRIDQAYAVGGFALMRKTMEDATGLSIDFQITFKDAVMQRLVDDVFEGVEVVSPMAFDVHPFYLDGIKYPEGHFPQGPQRITGRQAIQFIKTVPIAEGAYDRFLEHNSRKSLVFDGLLRALDDRYRDRTFWLKGAAFVTREYVNGAIACDFDPIALVANNIGGATLGLTKSLGSIASSEFRRPKIGQSKYVVDPAHGDGGVQWVNANAAQNPITQKDIDAGTYPTLAMEVPINANPYGDLVSGYWPSVRKLVKETLLNSRGFLFTGSLRGDEE